MSNTDMFDYDAVPTWAGFIYQGYVGIYVALKYILDVSRGEELISKYELVLERLEDISILYRDDCNKERIVSIHQVKSKKDTTLGMYMDALKQLMYERARTKKKSGEIKAYLHIRKELSNVPDGDISKQLKEVVKKIKESYKKIKDYYNRQDINNLDESSRTKLLEIINKDGFSINRSEYIKARKKIKDCLSDVSKEVKQALEEYISVIEKWIDISDLDSNIELYKYKDGYYIEYDNLEREIRGLITEYTISKGKNYNEDEIKYIYYLLTDEIVENITQRHKNFESECIKIEIGFSHIIDVLNDSLDNYNKKLNILALKNIFYRHIYDYCDSECDKSLQKDCNKKECNLKKIQGKILELSEKDFGGFCYNLNPNCRYTIENRECLNELMQEDGILACFFKGAQMLKSEYTFRDNRCMYNIDKENEFLSGIYTRSEKSLRRVVERIERNIQDNRKKEDLINLFEADKIIIKGAEADSNVWNNEVIKNAYEEKEDKSKEKRVNKKEENYIINFKKPKIVDVDKVICEEN